MEETKEKKKVSIKNILLATVIGILTISTIFFAYLYLTQDTLDVDTQTPQDQQEDTPIVQRENPLPIFVLTQKYSQEAPCQPTTFDPATDTYTLVEDEETTYRVEGYDGGFIYSIRDEELPSPYTTEIFEFGCASSFSYVIEIKKNSVRQSLFTHVYDYSFSDDGTHLYLRNSELDGDNWVIGSKIVNILTKEENILPDIGCFDSASKWESDRLLTHTIDEEFSDYRTNMCIWEKDATLLSRIDLNIAIGASSRYFIAEQYGLLPNDPDTMYVYTTREDNTCSLFLANIYGDENINHIDIYEKQENDYYCADPSVEFDLSELDLNGGSVRYRVLESQGEEFDAVYGEWMTKSF